MGKTVSPVQGLIMDRTATASLIRALLIEGPITVSETAFHEVDTNFEVVQEYDHQKATVTYYMQPKAERKDLFESLVDTLGEDEFNADGSPSLTELNNKMPMGVRPFSPAERDLLWRDM